MLNGYYNQLLVALALIFGATVGIADALADAVADDSDAEVVLKLAPEQTPAVVSQPLSVGPAPSDAPRAIPSSTSSDAATAAPSTAGSNAPSVAVSAAVSVPEVVPAALDAVKATQQALISRNLPAWLLAFASILWAIVAVLRRVGRLNSRKAVAVFTLVAAVLGGLASQLLLGVNLTDAIVIAFGGPGAIALNEVFRAFGFFASSNPGSGDLPKTDA